MKKFEYHYVQISPAQCQNPSWRGYLNTLGEDGWELVGITNYAGYKGATAYFIYTFKREIE